MKNSHKDTKKTLCLCVSRERVRTRRLLPYGPVRYMFGVQFQNDTGEELTELSVQYVCEQWRRGGSGDADRLDFQISANATSLTTGTWVNANALDCISPVTTGSAGAIDGNASANRTAVSGLIGGLSIANGATFWLRWTDLDISVANDGLAVDNFTLAPSALAAALVSFDAVQSGDAILVSWETVSEVGNVGFNLWRGTTPDAQLNSGLIPSQGPGSSQGFSYEWLDATNLVNNTTYYYWLEDVDIAGLITRHGPISADRRTGVPKCRYSGGGYDDHLLQPRLARTCGG